MESPIPRIHSLHASFSKGEQLIADQVMNNFQNISNLTIAQLAEICDVAESSIFRFTQKLGYNGYRDFKMACMLHSQHLSDEKSPFKEVTDIDKNTYEYTLKSFIKTDIENLSLNFNQMDYDKLEEIAKSFTKAEHIYIWGIGFSGHLGQGFASRLRSLLVNVSYATNNFEMAQDSYKVEKKDLILAISNSGNTYLTENIKRAKEANAKVISMTGSHENSLANTSDDVIVFDSYFKDYKPRYIGQEMLIKVILDALYVYLENESYDSKTPKHQQFLNHFPRMNE